MYSIRLTSSNPALNLATEEYLLKHDDNDFFILWVNKPSVIVGKHQNIYAEIDYHYARGKKLSLFRRISGGGAVFHDTGNVNFSFIINKPGRQVLNYRDMLSPIINALGEAGIKAEFDGRNGLMIDGYKISGCAQHISKNRLLHHGTLLFDSNLNMLNRVLKTRCEYSHKSIHSVPGKVTNISNYLQGEMNMNDFMKLLTLHVQNEYGIMDNSFEIMENSTIHQLMKEKYHLWEWNVGRSPDYTFKTVIPYNGDDIPVSFTVHKGYIQTMHIDDKQFPGLSNIARALVNVRHEEKAIHTICNQTGLDPGIGNLLIKHIL